MEMRELRYFLAAFEEGSISAAARRCHIAQPSVSAAVRKLEEELGTQLFERSRRGIAPLPAAIELAGRTRGILGAVADLRSISGEAGTERPNLALYVHPTVSIGKLARMLAVLTGMANVEIVTERGVAEAAIEPGVGAREEYRLWRERYVLCLPEDHPLAKSKTLNVSDLTGIRLVSRCECERSHLLPVTVLRPVIVAQAPDEERALAFVEAGIGAAIMPEFDATGRRVVLRTIDNLELSRDVMLHGLSHAVHLVRSAFNQSVGEVCGDDSNPGDTISNSPLTPVADTP